MKNLERKLLSMGLMLAMAFNCANIGKCLELIGEDKEVKLARENNERSVFGKLLSKNEISKLLFYYRLMQGPAKESRAKVEKDLFGRVLSECKRLAILYYVEGLKAEFGPKLPEAFGLTVRKEAKDFDEAKAGPMESGSMRAKKCDCAAEDGFAKAEPMQSFSKASPAKSGPMRAEESKSVAKKWDLGDEL